MAGEIVYDIAEAVAQQILARLAQGVASAERDPAAGLATQLVGHAAADADAEVHGLAVASALEEHPDMVGLHLAALLPARAACGVLGVSAALSEVS